MECEKVKSLLPGYLDGALHLDTEAETHLSIGRHLELCEECREDLQSYLALSSLMSLCESV
jgi:predicted anti-sigma-YlaC factor YlaD